MYYLNNKIYSSFSINLTEFVYLLSDKSFFYYFEFDYKNKIVYYKLPIYFTQTNEKSLIVKGGFFFTAQKIKVYI